MARRRLPPPPPVEEREDPRTRSLLWWYRLARHVEREAVLGGSQSANLTTEVDEVLGRLGDHLGYPVTRAAAERLVAERHARTAARHRAWRQRTGR